MLAWGPKAPPAASGAGRRLLLAEDHAVPMPVVGHAHGVIAEVAELEAPHAIDFDRCHGELGLGVLALQCLAQGDAVEDERARQVDRVDPAALAGAVNAGRAGAEGVGHSHKGTSSPTLSPEAERRSPDNSHSWRVLGIGCFG